jgi:hypothetical protein
MSGNVNLDLQGAALNTLAFLNMLGMVGCPAAVPPKAPITPNSPMLQTASLSKGTKIADFASPVGIK